jgi:hypothetical protein
VSLHPQLSQQDSEKQFLEGLRARYEDEGFTFSAHPGSAQLPEFLGSYRPDALAQRPGRNIAIEVKRRQSASEARALRDIRRLFEGRADWQFHVVFMGADPLESLTIPAYGAATVLNDLGKIRSLIGQGHHRAAYILAWSLLEATARTLNDEPSGHSSTPDAVVQTLATNGYIEPEMERQMRSLIDLRNRIVHGDLGAEPTAAEVELVLSAIEETLNAKAS